MTVRGFDLLLRCAKGRTGMARPMLICDQPRTLPPPKMDLFDDRPSTQSSFAPSQWLAEGRGLVSRASSRASFAVNSSRSRRPTIGDPSDFRRVPISDRGRDDFRPLELSIYLPGNNLTPLPFFSAALESGHVNVEYPANALVRARTDSVLYRPSTSFTIPRKPVASIAETASIRGSRHSVDGRLNRSNTGTHSRSHSFSLGSGILNSESTQEFLAALDTRLPQCPSPSPTPSATDFGATIHRRASEQSLRLRTHLEERQEMERRLNEIETIVEEKQTEEQLVGIKHRLRANRGSPSLPRHRPVRSTTLSDFRRPMERPLPPTPMSFYQPNPRTQPPPPPPPPKPRTPTPQAVPISTNASLAPESDLPQSSSTRARVSHWLFRWIPEQLETAAREVQPSAQPFYQCAMPSTRSHTASESAVSAMSNPSDDSSTLTFTTASSLEHRGITPPPYQALPPYQEYETTFEKPSGLSPGSVEVDVAV